MKTLIAGASGQLGSALAASLQSDGHDVVSLVRREPAHETEFQWNPAEGTIDGGAFVGVDTVVNYTGAGVGDKRWSDARKDVLRDSRIGTTALLAQTITDLDDKPALFLNQSAIGIYGDRGDEVITEDSVLGLVADFLAKLTKDWEAATAPVRDAGVRTVCARTGIVLIPGVQFLGRLVPLFKVGLGGPIGRGTQFWSWITLADQVAAMRFIIDSDLEGPVNVTGPNPIRQKDFAETLGRVLGRPAIVPTPSFAIKAAMGSEAGQAVGLAGTRVVPERLLDAGFEFGDPDLEQALTRLLATG